MASVEQGSAEYLTQHNWESPYLSGMPGWEELIKRREVYSPKQLTLILEDARRFLCTEPGEHLRERQAYSQDWLGWWIEYFRERTTWRMKELLPSEKVATVAQVRGKLLLANVYTDSGLITGAGLEGTPGHRSAVGHMAKHVRGVVIGFEQDGYMQGKARKSPFLSLAIRMSMWAQIPEVSVVTVLPEIQDGIDISSHYLSLHHQIGARYSFGSADDPHLSEKIARGDKADFLLIPNLDSPRTSDRVRRLLDSPFADTDSLPELGDDFL